MMSTSDELNLAQDRSISGFVSAGRQLKIDWTKFNPVQVDMTFFTAAWQLKVDVWKLIQEIAWFYVYFTGQMFWIKNLFILWEQ